MSHESSRYDTVSKFRVEDVEQAYFSKSEKLYRVVKQDEGFRYELGGLGKKKFGSIDEALTAVRKAFHGSTG